MWHCFGKPGLILITLFQFFYAYGGNPTTKYNERKAVCAYQVIIGDTLPSVFSHILSENNILYSFLTSRYSMIFFCTLFISLPLSLFRDLSKLSRASFVSLIAMLFIITAVVIRGPMQTSEYTGDFRVRYNFINVGVVEAIGIISFGNYCIEIVLIL